MSPRPDRNLALHLHITGHLRGGGYRYAVPPLLPRPGGGWRGPESSLHSGVRRRPSRPGRGRRPPCRGQEGVDRCGDGHCVPAHVAALEQRPGIREHDGIDRRRSTLPLCDVREQCQRGRDRALRAPRRLRFVRLGDGKFSHRSVDPYDGYAYGRCELLGGPADRRAGPVHYGSAACRFLEPTGESLPCSSSSTPPRSRASDRSAASTTWVRGTTRCHVVHQLGERADMHVSGVEESDRHAASFAPC